MGKKAPKLPIQRDLRLTGKDGKFYVADVSIKKTSDTNKYPPDGIKAVFRLFNLKDTGEKELVVLIDNHEPFGFHEHLKPLERELRKKLHISDWQQAWGEFQNKIKEISDGPKKSKN